MFVQLVTSLTEGQKGSVTLNQLRETGSCTKRRMAGGDVRAHRRGQMEAGRQKKKGRVFIKVNEREAT